MPNITLTATAQSVTRLKAALLGSNFPILDGETDSDYIKRWVSSQVSKTVKTYESRQAAVAVQLDKNLIN